MEHKTRSLYQDKVLQGGDERCLRKLPYYCPISEIPRAPLAENTLAVAADSTKCFPTCLVVIDGTNADMGGGRCCELSSLCD